MVHVAHFLGRAAPVALFDFLLDLILHPFDLGLVADNFAKHVLLFFLVFAASALLAFLDIRQLLEVGEVLHLRDLFLLQLLGCDFLLLWQEFVGEVDDASWRVDEVLHEELALGVGVQRLQLDGLVILQVADDGVTLAILEVEQVIGIFVVQFSTDAGESVLLPELLAALSVLFLACPLLLYRLAFFAPLPLDSFLLLVAR